MKNIEQKKRQGRAAKNFQIEAAQRAFEVLMAEYAPADADALTTA